MLPSFSNNDYVLFFAPFFYTPRINQVVLVEHPRLGTIIKRIASHHPYHGYLLAGDNPQKSTSTEAMGWIDASNIYGRAIWHIKAPTD